MKKLPKFVQLWILKRKAMKLWKRHNVQLFIMPAINFKRADFVITSEKMQQSYNIEAKKLGHKQFSKKDLVRNCVCCTPPERSFRVI